MKNYDVTIIFDTGTNSIILPLEYLEGIRDDLAKFNCKEVRSGSSYQIMSNSVNNFLTLSRYFSSYSIISN